jgi:hypothetical protein
MSVLLQRGLSARHDRRGDVEGRREASVVGEAGGVELRIGDSAVMMFDARDGWPHTPGLYAPATTAYQRALAVGATPVTEVTALRDQPA